MDAMLKRSVTRMLILSAFGQKERYILEVAKLLDTHSNGVFMLKNIHVSIIKLEKDGYIEKSQVRLDPKKQRRRQYYRITDAGKARLCEMQDSYQKVTMAVSQVFDSVSADAE